MMEEWKTEQPDTQTFLLFHFERNNLKVVFAICKSKYALVTNYQFLIICLLIPGT